MIRGHPDDKPIVLARSASPSKHLWVVLLVVPAQLAAQRLAEQLVAVETGPEQILAVSLNRL